MTALAEKIYEQAIVLPIEDRLSLIDIAYQYEFTSSRKYKYGLVNRSRTPKSGIGYIEYSED
jgi:hypothetical protein